MVGGHCIGVDPYYLRALAEREGLRASVIRNARQVNEDVPRRILEQALCHAAAAGRVISTVQIGVSFKEDVPDFRNSQALWLAQELTRIGLRPKIVDPHVDQTEAGLSDLEFTDFNRLQNVDLLVLAVPHISVIESADWQKILAPDALVLDIKSALRTVALPEGVRRWSL